MNKRPQILMIGSTRGDEPLGSITLSYFIKKIVENRTDKFWDLLNTKMIVVAPLPNPKGFLYETMVKLTFYFLGRRWCCG